MSDDLSTQFPNPPELRPISSTSSKIWHFASLFLTIGGLTLMGLGGWIFVQRQIEASQPPPARILEVSAADLEPTATRSTAFAVEPTPTQSQPTAVAQNGREDTPVLEAKAPPIEEAAPEQVVSSPAGNSVESENAGGQETVSVTEAKLVEEATLAQETAAAEPTSEPPLSLADNPLPVVQEENAEQVEAAASENEATSPGPEATGLPLTRIVAESIALDSEVVEVGWQSVEQNGVSTNVWRVADYAAGWHKNSKLPGQGGNIVLSAHHNIKGEVFRYTVDLEPGDVVTLYDETQSYDYVVVDKFIVKDKGEPEAVRRANAKWIGPFNEERLTLVTCWPYNNNTHRLIVIAKPAGAD